MNFHSARTGLILFTQCFFISMILLQCSSPTEKNEKIAENVSKIVYQGWPNSIELVNDEVRVVVVPSIGRIMYYGLIDSENILWDDSELYGLTLPSNLSLVNQWMNFGGDKVWPTAQDDFPAINGSAWPPDPWFDGGAYDYELTEEGVRIISKVSHYCGARCTRHIKLAETGTRLTIEQTIEKVQTAARSNAEPIDYTIWSVTQIRPPQEALFPLNPESTLANGYDDFGYASTRQNFSEQNGIGIYTPDASRSQKIGSEFVEARHWEFDYHGPSPIVYEDVLFMKNGKGTLCLHILFLSHPVKNTARI